MVKTITICDECGLGIDPKESVVDRGNLGFTFRVGGNNVQAIIAFTDKSKDEDGITDVHLHTRCALRLLVTSGEFDRVGQIRDLFFDCS